MEHRTLKPLPYPRHALEPHIGRETVSLHYDKHHAGHLRKLKELVAGQPEATASLEWLVRTAEGAVLEHAAQVWSHDFYWRSMHPDGGGAPTGALADLIAESFGSIAAFRQHFVERGTEHFGSGWIWLVLHRGRLRLATTPHADLPLRHCGTPLLCADLWEHAYYLDRRDDRAQYLEAFVDRLANWDFAAANSKRGDRQGTLRRKSARLVAV
jgi:Fe-Mn family superoxide dismutase